jgi:hypothetical protein
MTHTGGVHYCRSSMEGWQSKAAFVIQFRETTDIEAGRLEGKVEHIASYKATRFHSVDELLAFVGRVLTEVRNTEP